MSVTKRLLRELLPQKWALLAVLLGAAASAVLGIVYPLLIAQAIEEIVSGGGHVWAGIPLLYALLLALLLLFVVRFLFGFIQERVMAGVSQTLVLRLREQVSGKLNRLPLRYYDAHKKGDILSRVTSDLEKVADTVQSSLSQLLSSTVAMAGSIAMMLWLSWPLALAVLAATAISLFVVALISEKTQRYTGAQQAALGAFNAGVEEFFTGNAVVKAYGLQDKMTGSVEALSEELYRAGKRAQFVTYIINPIIQLLNHLGYVVVAFGGALLVLRGGVSISYIPAFFQYTNKSSEAILNISYLVNTLQGAVAAAGRVYELLDEPEQRPDAGRPGALAKPRGEVAFEHVRFGYREDDILMEDVSFTAPAGSKIAVVGPTGAGKTTLVNLLMRFYELNGGRITIDGVDIGTIPRAELYATVGMVLQDTWLFRGSIGENIAYGRRDATPEQIAAAAFAARIDRFIAATPQGYDTVLDDETSGISAGQKQLLTIARALLADPPILILDEATSSVDTRTEAEIQKAMNRLTKGRTSFVIAHRLSTILDADRILVMREGTIVESGTHDELMAAGGFYSELYNAQFAAREEG